MSDAAINLHGRREIRYWRNPVAVWALVLGVLAHIAGFFAFSIHLPPPKAQEAPAPEIYFSGEGEGIGIVMQEQSDLMDFEPLFLPTSRNASINLGWSELVDRTEPFAALSPKLLIRGSDFPVVSEPFPKPLAKPVEMLEQDSAGAFGAFGQLTGQQSALPERPGRIEIYRDGQLQPVAYKEIDAGVITEAVDTLAGLMEWRLAVGEVGVVGQPLMIRGSGLEAVDAATAKYLVKIASQWGLPSGYYRIVIGP